MRLQSYDFFLTYANFGRHFRKISLFCKGNERNEHFAIRERFNEINISLHINNIFKEGELNKETNYCIFVWIFGMFIAEKLAYVKKKQYLCGVINKQRKAGIHVIPMDHIAADDALFLLEHFLARPVVR